MKIDKIELSHVRIPLNEPFRISSGAVGEKDGIVVRVWSEGVLGYGESSPMSGSFYSADTPESCLRALQEKIIPLALSQEFRDIEHLVTEVSTLNQSNFAIVGLETALWDIESQKKNEPLCKSLGGTADKIASGLAVGIYDTIPLLLKAIEKHLKDGYRRLKIKVQPGWDIEPVGAVKRAFPDTPLFVDANSAYTLDFVDTFKKLDEFGLMMYEQPMKGYDLEGHAVLQRQIKTPICLDESIEDLKAAQEAIILGSCKIVNIKIQRVGGLLNSLKIHDLCKENRIPVWCGTMPELGLGQIFGIHLGSLDNFLYPTDIEPSLRWFVDDIVDPFIEMDKDGYITVPQTVGLGYKVNEEKVKKYEISRLVFL